MAALTEEHFEAFQTLLKAPSKDVVRQLCRDSFHPSAEGSQHLTDNTANTLSVSHTQAQQLVQALHTLTHHVVFYNLSQPEQILSLFPQNFHTSLKNLLTKILLENSPVWRNEALANPISLSRLVEMDWRVDIKAASHSVTRMAVPTCLLHMKVQDTQQRDADSLTSVTVELSREKLDTMLDGLGRIRDQLAVVASK